MTLLWHLILPTPNLQGGTNMVDNPLGGVAWEEHNVSDASLQDWEAGHKMPRHLMATPG